MQVIGVIEDVRHAGLDSPAGAEWYEPASQFPHLPGLLVAVRTAGSPAAFAGTLEAAVHAIDPPLPVANVSPMTQLVSRTLARRRFNTTLLAGLAALGLNLLAVGVDGVMSHGVAQRASELALRLALGAGRAHVVRLVMGDALRLTLAGTAIGLVLALLSARLLRGLLFQVSPLDPLALAVAAVLVLLTALLAATLPALRAARTPPFRALRS
jgi:predicted lysophospholipase L1 biosynthesis ABC-type transport system permease subunit